RCQVRRDRIFVCFRLGSKRRCAITHACSSHRRRGAFLLDVDAGSDVMKTYVRLCCMVTVGALGCADVGQKNETITLFVAGTDLSEPVIAVGEIEVLVDRADLAFGPLYLCAGATAGELCDTARLEWLDSVVVDTTSPEPMQVGELTGVTGHV